MAQQDFERFKQEIREWLDSHPEEYDRFVAEVNDKSAIGLYKVFNVGMRLAPKLMHRYRAECHGDLAEERKIQDYAADIIRKSKFPQNPKRSVRFSGKRTKRSVQKRKARNTQKAETKVL